MTRPIFWTQERVAKALSLHTSGMSYDEIGRAWGRSAGAVNDALNRHRNGKVPFHLDKTGTGPAIGFTLEDARLRNDAIDGSARLLAEIERVFGQQRIAA